MVDSRFLVIILSKAFVKCDCSYNTLLSCFHWKRGPDRSWSICRFVVFPLCSPPINSKLCLFLIPFTWIVAMAFRSPHRFAYKLVKCQVKLICARKWNEVFGESSSYGNYFLLIFVIFLYTPLNLIIILYSLIVLKLKSQTMPGINSVNAGQ